MRNRGYIMRIIFLHLAIFLSFSSVAIQAKDNTINRTGFHTGVGGSFLVAPELDIPIPMLNVTLEYGFSPQSTVLLEHHGYVVGGGIALEYKHYIKEATETFYVMGGVIGGYMVDEDISDGVLPKIGLGYAWNHLESDIFTFGDSEDIVLGISVRYKF